jgi:GT2 family glycosyltransferase
VPLSIVIPTYGREEVLCDTIAQLLEQSPAADEIVVVDQTSVHESRTTDCLGSWSAAGVIRWVRLTRASQPLACNTGLREASQPFVLFLDDDIRIGSGFLNAHLQAFVSDGIHGVVGQVLQPGQDEDRGCPPPPSDGPLADLQFPFNSARPGCIRNGMSGNLCVRRAQALAIGGFDENYLPPVSYRFDSDFCKRLCRSGGTIVFEPAARIHHLRSPRGGTRSLSSHLTSASPVHGQGDYYFALRQGLCWATLAYIMRRPWREVRTRFHLRHPWFVPVKLLGEMRALLLALRLWRQGPRLLPTKHTNGHE